MVVGIFSISALMRSYTLCEASLTFKSLAITLRTTMFKIKKFYMLITLHLCVLYGSQNKQQLLPYTALTDCFL